MHMEVTGMATAHRRLPSDAPTDHLPDDLPKVPSGWTRITDRDDLSYGERTAWVHEETDLRVSVKRDRKPTQMHTPETSTDDTGFIGYVRGEYGGQLTYDLASKVRAYEAAVRFMAAYPNGQYEVPEPGSSWGNEPIDWRAADE